MHINFADYFEAAKKYLEFTIPLLVTSPGMAERYLNTFKGSDTHPRHRILQRIQTRVVSIFVTVWLVIAIALSFA